MVYEESLCTEMQKLYKIIFLCAGKGEWFYIKDLHEKNRGIGLYKIGNANIVTFVAQSRALLR